MIAALRPMHVCSSILKGELRICKKIILHSVIVDNCIATGFCGRNGNFRPFPALKSIHI